MGLAGTSAVGPSRAGSGEQAGLLYGGSHLGSLFERNVCHGLHAPRVTGPPSFNRSFFLKKQKNKTGISWESCRSQTYHAKALGHDDK